MTIRKAINEVKKMFPEANLKANRVNGEEVSFNGFIPIGRCFLYISSTDKRFDPNYRNNILIRTAENERDFTGGQNYFIDLDKIDRKQIVRMFLEKI
ncbi:MAG: hypothetical protein R6U15_06555 [Candidatus Izemoplasmatales bacterium]